jgi:hypothetical protein
MHPAYRRCQDARAEFFQPPRKDADAPCAQEFTGTPGGFVRVIDTSVTDCEMRVGYRTNERTKGIGTAQDTIVGAFLNMDRLERLEERHQVRDFAGREFQSSRVFFLLEHFFERSGAAIVQEGIAAARAAQRGGIEFVVTYVVP